MCINYYNQIIYVDSSFVLIVVPIRVNIADQIIYNFEYRSYEIYKNVCCYYVMVVVPIVILMLSIVTIIAHLHMSSHSCNLQG
jgi:hypothetical protein